MKVRKNREERRRKQGRQKCGVKRWTKQNVRESKNEHREGKKTKKVRKQSTTAKKATSERGIVELMGELQTMGTGRRGKKRRARRNLKTKASARFSIKP